MHTWTSGSLLVRIRRVSLSLHTAYKLDFTLGINAGV